MSLFLITDNNIVYKAKIGYSGGSFMQKVLIEQKRSGTLKWRLTAERANHLTDDKIRLEDVNIYFPEKDFSLSTKEALYNVSTRSFVIPGEVRAYAKGYDIEGKDLHWDATSSSLHAEGGIRIMGKGFMIEGERLRAHQDKAEIDNNVKAVFYGN